MHHRFDASGSPLLGDDFPLPLGSPFSCHQAAAAGISRHALSELVVSGLVRRLLRGVYVPAQTSDSLELRTKALALVVPADAILVDWTACWLWTGVLAPGEHLDVPEVSLFRPAGAGRLRNRLCRSGERSFLPGDIAEVGGLHVSTPLRTAWDLARFFHRDIALGGMDALLRLGSFDLDDLVGGVDRFRRQRGVVQLRALAPLADGRSESPAESTLRLRWHDLASLPQPQPQVPVVDASGRELARVDLGIDELRFGVEYDGQEFHSREKDRSHDTQRRDWLEREYGWLIKAVRRENVYGPTRDIERIIREGIVEARRTLSERSRRFARQ
jgi:hypothetical protein